PWGRLAMGQASAPTAGWSAIGGPPVLTFLLALAGASVAYLVITALTASAGASTSATASATGQVDSGIHPRFRGWIRQSTWRLPGRADESRKQRRRTVAATGLTVLAIGVLVSGNLAWNWTPGKNPSAVVATIQGNVPHSRTLPDQLRAT